VSKTRNQTSYTRIYNSRNSFNLLKGVLYARSSRLIPDKANLGFRLVTDLVVVEHVKFLLGTMYSGLFWM
jgi:hypothetical protein